MVLSPSQNNTTATGDQAAAADPTDPLQPGEIHLHSWMLYTSQAPVLDLTGKGILRKTLKMHFMPSICVYKKTTKRSLMAEKKQEEPAN